MIEPFLVAALVAGGAAVLKLLHSSSGREQDEAWKLAARRVQGELELAPGTWLKSATRVIFLEVRGVALVIDAYEDRDGKTRVEYTRVSSGALPGASGIALVVSPRGLLRKLSKGLGIGESPTGDDDFDAAIHVSATPRGIAGVFLDRAMRAVVVQADTKLEIEGGRLRIVVRGHPESAEPLVAMTRFAERIVERWISLTRGATRVAERLGLVCEADVDLVEKRVFARGLHRGRATSMTLVVDDDGARTLVTCEGLDEMAFDGLEPDPEEVVAALASAVDARTDGYR